jgi:hypothetical protein
VVIFTARIIQIYTKFANFTGLYFLHFTTFSNQSSFLDQNLVHSWNHPLVTISSLASFSCICKNCGIAFDLSFIYLFRKDKAYKQLYSELVSWIRKATAKAEVTGALSHEEGRSACLSILDGLISFQLISLEVQ